MGGPPLAVGFLPKPEEEARAVIKARAPTSLLLCPWTQMLDRMDSKR